MTDTPTREDWQVGELWLKFTDYIKGGTVAILLLIGAIGLFASFYNGFKTHKAEVAKIESAPVELPPIKTEPNKKFTTKKVAKQVTEPYTLAANVPVVRINRTTETDSFASDFETRVKNFERKIP